MSRDLLAVTGLTIDYRVEGVLTRAVSDLSFAMAPGEIFGLVGESGSGKSTLMMAILGGLPAGGKIGGGQISLAGRDLLRLGPSEWSRVRWRQLAYVPQGAMNALNPVLRLGEQFEHILRDHDGLANRSAARRASAHALSEMNLPEDVLDRFPHQLSGGMRQRACIAMAILLSPSLIIADEPTSALDVVSQRLVVEALAKVRREKGTSLIFVGHDLALQAQIADRIGIMFAGRFVEIGPARSIFAAPSHPYTQRLLAAVPNLFSDGSLPGLNTITDDERASWQAGRNRLQEIDMGHYVAIP